VTDTGGKAAPQKEELSLGELESIVYDFINFNSKRHNQEFIETRFKPQDVKKEDLMKIQRLDKKKADE